MSVPFMITRRQLISASVAASIFGLPVKDAVARQAEPVPYDTVTIGDRKIGYRSVGTGQPLVLIMGFAGTMDSWDPAFVAALARNHQVVMFDNRGIGSSSQTGNYAFANLADDAVDLIDELGFDTVDVFGWSLGGMVALDLATRHGDRVRHLVAHAADPGGSTAISGDTGSFFDFSASEEEQDELQLRLMFPEEWLEQHRDQAEAVFSRPHLPVSSQSVLLQANALLEWYRQEHVLRAISSPTLILHGTDDMVIPVGNAQLLADVIPDSWLVRLPGGHGLHYQLPDEMVTIINLFMNSAA
ncbi:MAG: alpha/beta hydrolase [Thermomicrobiales bacterium]